MRQIETNLRVHNAIEEEIFYPAFKNAGDGKDDAKMYFEALEEHRAAGDLVLPDLLKTEVDSEKFSGRAKVLKELFEHHADEEEKEMFTLQRQLLEEWVADQVESYHQHRQSEKERRLLDNSRYFDEL